VTSGLIDVLRCTWGERHARFAGVEYRRPVARLERATPAAADWVAAQLRPKVLVATQTKVLEATVDETGDLVPSTPVVAVHADPERLWHLAAALSAPPITAHALHVAAGAALSTGAVKLSARQVLELPLPVDPEAWDRGAALARDAARATSAAARRATLATLGTVMCAAYGVTAEGVVEWWLDRIR
jgi:hypothetical protein